MFGLFSISIFQNSHVHLISIEKLLQWIEPLQIPSNTSLVDISVPFMLISFMKKLMEQSLHCYHLLVLFIHSFFLYFTLLFCRSSAFVLTDERQSDRKRGRGKEKQREEQRD